MLRTLPDQGEHDLPQIPEPVAFAKVEDTGNLVLYGSKSQIIWQSDDHPSEFHPRAEVISSYLGKLNIQPQIWRNLLRSPHHRPKEKSARLITPCPADIEKLGSETVISVLGAGLLESKRFQKLINGIWVCEGITVTGMELLTFFIQNFIRHYG